MSHPSDVKDETITEIIPLSSEWVKRGDAVIEEARELDRQTRAIKDRARILSAEIRVLDEKQQAIRNTFYRDLYALYPQLADTDCAYSTIHKAIVVYKEEKEEISVDKLKRVFEMMAAAQAQPPKEGAN